MKADLRVTPDEVTRPPRRGSRRARALVASLLAPFLSLALVVTTPTTAQAAVDLGDAAAVVSKVAPKAMPAAGFAIGGPVLGTLGFVGMAAYETRDSWMPVVADWWDGLFNGSTPNSGSLANQIALTLAPSGLVGVISYTASRGNDSGSLSTDFTIQFTDTQCRTDAGDYINVANTSSGTLNSIAKNSAESYQFTLCPPNAAIAYVRAYIRNTASSTDIRSATKTYSEPAVANDPGFFEQTADVRCRKYDDDGSGGAGVGFTESLIQGLQTGTPDRIYIPSCEEAVPGSIPVEITIKGGPRGGGTNTKTVIHRQVMDDSRFEEWRDCFGPSGVKCSIRVFINGDACTVGDAACVDWQTYDATHPGRVECRFGSHVIGLHNCNVLRRAYRPDVTGKPIVKPAAEPGGDPDVATTPDPGTGTGGEPAPTSGPNPDPSTDPGSVPNPGPTTDPQSQNCWGTGWSWNPVSWVYVPTRCALSWAFVPEAGYLDGEVSDIKAGWDASAPGGYMRAVTGQTWNLSAGGCEGIPVNLPEAVGGVSFAFGASCSGVMATAATITRLAATAMLLVFGPIACLRAIGSGLGWDPGIGRKGAT